MFQQDYIMRQVRQLTEVLTRILFKKKQGEHEEAQSIIATTLGELMEDSAKELEDLSLSETLAFFDQDGEFQAEWALVVADILYEKRKYLEDSTHCSLQVLLLYKKAQTMPDVAFPLQAFAKITELETELKGSTGLEEINKIIRNGKL